MRLAYRCIPCCLPYNCTRSTRQRIDFGALHPANASPPLVREADAYLGAVVARYALLHGGLSPPPPCRFMPALSQFSVWKLRSRNLRSSGAIIPNLPSKSVYKSIHYTFLIASFIFIFWEQSRGIKPLTNLYIPSIQRLWTPPISALEQTSNTP